MSGVTEISSPEIGRINGPYLTLAVAGGGTGGHVYPGVAVAEEVRKRGGEVFFIGTKHGLESAIVPAAGFPLHTLPASPMLRGHPLQNFGSIFTNLRGVSAARGILTVLRPDVILGTGGYVSFAACLAARSLGVPVVLHEQNAVPGMANRYLSRIAACMLTSWTGGASGKYSGVRQECLLPGAVRVGMPVRAAFRVADRRTARAGLGIAADEKLVVVFGGSRGARSLNDAVSAWLIRSPSCTVIWATGADHVESCRAAAINAGTRVRVMPYIDRMPEILPAADLAVTRAGAMTLAELALCGVPSVLVPYPHATEDHQTANARALVDAGAAVLVSDQEIKDRLPNVVADLLADHDRRASMAAASRSLGNLEAAAEIVDILEELIK